MSRPFAAKQTTMLRRRSSIVERIINIILNPNRLLYKMMIHRNFKGISLDLLASFPKVKGKTNNLSEIRGAIVYSFPQLFKEPLSLDKHETMICFSESQRKELVDNAHLCQIMRYLTGTFDARFHENSVRSDLCSIVDFQFEHLGKKKGVTRLPRWLTQDVFFVFLWGIWQNLLMKPRLILFALHIPKRWCVPPTTFLRWNQIPQWW